MFRFAPVFGVLVLAACVPPSGPYTDGMEDPVFIENTDTPSDFEAIGDDIPHTHDMAGVDEGSKDAHPDTADTEPLLTENADAGRISDEQDFDAVSTRHTIESDAARLMAQREAYLEIRIGELPERGDGTVPNIVEFALSTANSVGEQIWPRSSAFSQERYRRNCAIYAYEDFAQEAFLANGGPDRNWKGLDPDGDGFACGWDPAPFRASVASGG